MRGCAVFSGTVLEFCRWSDEVDEGALKGVLWVFCCVLFGVRGLRVQLKVSGSNCLSPGRYVIDMTPHTAYVAPVVTLLARSCGTKNTGSWLG